MKVLGNGSAFGIRLTFKVQPNPEGLAQAFIIGEDFIGNDSVCLVLGDNIFWGHGFSPMLEKASSKSQQRLFGMVHAYNKGELEKKDVDSDLYDKIKKIANGMTQKDAKKIAKTDHTDLPEKVPTNDVYDKLNHLTILWAENSFENIDGDGTELHISKNERKFTIKYDDSFYMVSENYNFDLGCEDINEVVSTFIKLSNQTETALKEDYRMSTM